MHHVVIFLVGAIVVAIIIAILYAIGRIFMRPGDLPDRVWIVLIGATAVMTAIAVCYMVYLIGLVIYNYTMQ